MFKFICFDIHLKQQSFNKVITTHCGDFCVVYTYSVYKVSIWKNPADIVRCPCVTDLGITSTSEMAARMGRLVGFLLLGLLLTVDGTNWLGDMNREYIDVHEMILKDRVRADLETLKGKFKGLVTHVNEKLTLLRSYTTDSIEQLKNDAHANMEERDTTLKNNINELERHTREKVADLKDKMFENLKALDEASSEQRMWIRDWNDRRSRRHEEILSSNVGLCAYDENVGFENQTVTYNSAKGGFLDQHRSWQVLGGPKYNDETSAMRVLNRTSGMFKVPTGATGLYLFTFSVTMDTADLNTTEPSEYEFVKNGKPIPGTRMYSDAGVRRPGHGQTGIYDMVSGSNTILLKLEEDDEVGVKQLEDTDIPDYSVSFCGTLIHLEKVVFYFATNLYSTPVFRPRSLLEGWEQMHMILIFLRLGRLLLSP